MDKLDLLSAQPGRVNVQVASGSQGQQARLEQQKAQAAEAISRENQRAAGDSVEISAEALELLRSIKPE